MVFADLWILAFIVMMTTGQLLFKATSSSMPESSYQLMGAWKILLDWRFMLAIVLYGTATLLWLRILKDVPLSTAYPLVMGTTITATTILSIILFRENLSAAKLIGTGLVVVAVALLSK
jgi:multidrug transporter EmrE-like cation transporter